MSMKLDLFRQIKVTKHYNIISWHYTFYA